VEPSGAVARKKKKGVPLVRHRQKGVELSGAVAGKKKKRSTIGGGSRYEYLWSGLESNHWERKQVRKRAEAGKEESGSR
tara:strand:+ start:358 stop:594 length:237 start_codon:yes stop_codon:yes gene_type:complete